MGMLKMNEVNDKDKKTDIGNESTTSSTTTITVLSGSSASDNSKSQTDQNISKKLRKTRKDKGTHHNFKKIFKKNETKPIKLDTIKKTNETDKTIVNKPTYTNVIVVFALLGLALLFLLSVIIPKQTIDNIKSKIKGRQEFYE